MSKFVLTAQLQLQAPNNTAQVVKQIQDQLQGVKVNLQVQNASKAQADIRGLSDSLDKADKKANTLGKTLGLSIKRFTALAIATRAVSLFTNTLRKAVETSIDFERELLKISQVTGTAMNDLRGLTNEITRLSTSLGVASTSILSVGRILSQAGLNARETQVALSALAKTELAPTFDDITQTAEGAVAIFNQFKQGASSLEAQLGSLNAVAGQFAVESGDLISVIRRTGGVFKQAGGDLNELIALFTSVRSTTRESAESIATGLRTIFTRIQRPETIKYLEQFGVKLTDLEGKFIGPYKAVGELNKALAGLEEGDITFIQIAEELGGFRQIGKVLPLIKEYAVAQQALKVAQEGSNSLAADAAKAQASLAVRILKVKEEFLALIRSVSETSTFQIMANSALGLASALIKIADAVKPLLPLLGALAGIRIAKGLAGAFGSFLGRGSQAAGLNSGGVVRKFAIGGIVPGSGNSDTVPAMLTPGEFVLKKSVAQSIGTGNLNKLNSGGAVQKYKAGTPLGGAKKRGRPVAEADYELTQEVGQLAAYPGSAVSPGKDKGTFGITAKSLAKHSEDAQDAIDYGEVRPNETVRVSGTVNSMLLGPEGGKAFGASQWLDSGLGQIDKKVNSSLGKLGLGSSKSSLKDDQAVREKVEGFTLESFISGLLGKAAEGRKEAFDFKGDFSNQLGSDLTITGKPPRYLDAKRTLLSRGEIIKKGIDDTDVDVVEKFADGGLVQKFADGGLVKNRKVGYIDYDVIANPANEEIVNKGMESSGVKGLRLYSDHLTSLAVSARKDSDIQKLRAIYGVAGSGKTTLARGQGTDDARLRKTERFPILTPEDIQKATEVIVLSSSVSKKKLDEVFENTDRTYTLSSTTDAEKARVKSQRLSRDETGVGLEGRKPGTTIKAEDDTAVGEALLADRLGDKSVVLARKESGGVRAKRPEELVEVIKKKIGFTWGGFSPMTAGHESIMDAAKAVGIPYEDFIYLVGSNEAIKNSDPSSYRTAIFDQDARVLLAKAGAGSRGATVLPKDKGFEVPQAFDVGEKGGKRQVVVPAKGSVTFAADKSESSLSKYKDAGYDVKNIERTGGISGTQVRDLIMSGNMGQLQEVLSPNVYELISNNIKRIQNRANALPEIIADVKKREDISLAGIEKQIKSLGISRIDNKRVESDPEYAAQVEVLKELRKKRDKIKSFASFEPYSILDKMATAEPDQYGLDLSMPSSGFEPMRTIGKSNIQKASLGGLIQRFKDGGEVESLSPYLQNILSISSPGKKQYQLKAYRELLVDRLNDAYEGITQQGLPAIEQDVTKKTNIRTVLPDSTFDSTVGQLEKDLKYIEQNAPSKTISSRFTIYPGLTKKKGFDPGQMIDAMYAYQGLGMDVVVNKALAEKRTNETIGDFFDRIGKDSSDLEDVKDINISQVSSMLSAAAQYTPPKTLYSGLGKSKAQIILDAAKVTRKGNIRDLIGKTFSMPSFLSTASEQELADNFAREGMLTIATNQNKKVSIPELAKSTTVDRTPISKRKTQNRFVSGKESRSFLDDFDAEDEFILPPNSKFKITYAQGDISRYLDLYVQQLNKGGEVQKFAIGGVVPGTGNRDTVPATLQAGDFVIRKKSSQEIGGPEGLAKAVKYATGGGVDKSVPALLTPGEIVVPKADAQRIGYNKLDQINKKGAYAFGGTIQKLNTGGEVQKFSNGTKDRGAQLTPRQQQLADIKAQRSALVEQLRQEENERKRGSQKEGPVIDETFGLAALNGVSDASPQVQILPLTGAQVKIQRGVLDQKKTKVYETYMKKSFIKTAKTLAKRFTKDVAAEPMGDAEINDLVNKAGFYNAVGAYFESALALTGAPYEGNAGKSEINDSIDFPSGLGSAAKNFKLDSDWPTDATRTSGRGKSLADYRGQVERYLFKTGKLEKPLDNSLKNRLAPKSRSAVQMAAMGGIIQKFAGGGKASRKVDFESGVGPSPFETPKTNIDYYSLEQSSGFKSREFDELVQYAKTNAFSLDEFRSYLTKRAADKKSRVGSVIDPKSLQSLLMHGATGPRLGTGDLTEEQKKLAEMLKSDRPDPQYNPDYDRARGYASGGIVQKLAGGGAVSLYHGSNTGVNDSVLKSFQTEGARSDIAQGYGQGAGLYVYSGKERAKQQAMMRVGGGGGFTVVSGDTKGRPMVVSFKEQLDPSTWDLDYELNKGSVVQWLYDNYDKLKDQLQPDREKGLAGIRGVVDKDRDKGVMSAGISIQSSEGKRKTLYAGTEADLREGEFVGQIMSRLQTQDPNTVAKFERQFFDSPDLVSGAWDNLAIKYVGPTPLKPTNIEIFASGGIVPGTGNRDTVPASLQAGDFVIRKRSVQSIGADKLSSMTGYASGGDVQKSVPALLTPGEWVFPRKQAQQIGYSNLNRMNKLGKYANGGVVGGVSKFAGGGLVPIQRFAAGSTGSGVAGADLSDLVDSIKDLVKGNRDLLEQIVALKDSVDDTSGPLSGPPDPPDKKEDDEKKNTKKAQDGIYKTLMAMAAVTATLQQFRPAITDASNSFTTGFAAVIDTAQSLAVRFTTLQAALQQFGLQLNKQTISELFTGAGKTNRRIGVGVGRGVGNLAKSVGINPATAAKLSKKVANVTQNLVPFAATLGFAVTSVGLFNSALETFYNYSQRLNKAIEEGDVEKAGEMGEGKYALESANTARTSGAVIGAAVGSIIPGIGTAIGAGLGVVFGTLSSNISSLLGSDNSAKLLAQSQAGLNKITKDLELNTKAANEEMQRFKEGNATVSDVLNKFESSIAGVAAQQERTKDYISKTENPEAFKANKAGTLRDIGAYLGGGLFGVETSATYNARMEEQSKVKDETGKRSEEVLSAMQPVVNTFARQVAVAGGDFDTFTNNLSASNEAGKKYIEVATRTPEATERLREKFENIAREAEKTRKALEAMNLGFTSVNGTANATALALNNYLNAQNAGYSGLSNSLATLEASMTSAAQGISSEDFEASLGNASNVLRKFGGTEEQIKKFEDNVKGVNAAQKGLPDSFKRAKEALQAEQKKGLTGQATGKSQSDAVIDSLVNDINSMNIGEDVKKSLTDQVKGIKFEEADLEKISAGDFSVLEQKLGDIGNKQLEQVRNAIQKEIEIQQKINETVQKRLDLEDKFVQAQQRAVDIMMEMKEGIAQFGGKEYTPEQRRSDIVSRANKSLDRAGVTGLQDGSPQELRRVTNEIQSGLDRIANVRIAAGGGTVGVNGQQITPAQQAAARQEMEGESGVNLEKEQQRLNSALQEQYNTTKALIDTKKQELNLIKEKNKLERKAMDDLIAGDMESFFDTMAAQGAQAAIATGDERLMNVYGGEALGMAAQENRRLQEAGVTTLYGQNLAGPGGLTERGFQAVADRAGIADPTFAQAAAGTTVEEAAAEKEIRELYKTMEPLAQAMEKSAENDLKVGQQMEFAAKELGGAAVVLQDAAVKLGGDPNKANQQAAGNNAGGGKNNQNQQASSVANKATINSQTAVTNVGSPKIDGGSKGAGIISGTLSSAARNPAGTLQTVNAATQPPRVTDQNIISSNVTQDVDTLKSTDVKTLESTLKSLESTIKEKKEQESTSVQSVGAISNVTKSSSKMQEQQGASLKSQSFGIDPEILNKFSSALEKFNTDLSANIDRLENTKFQIELKPTNININLNGGTFLENLRDNLKEELIREIGQRMQNQGFNPDGSPRSANGSNLR